eukprot:scaffold15853_cov47-Prasinocladus_malaysianus.AAC.3
MPLTRLAGVIFVWLLASLPAWDNGMTWTFLLVALIALAISRALNVYPLAALVNFLRPEDVKIPRSHQHMLWFSGLRGAIAFALSLSAAEDLGGEAPRIDPAFAPLRLQRVHRG